MWSGKNMGCSGILFSIKVIKKIQIWFQILIFLVKMDDLYYVFTCIQLATQIFSGSTREYYIGTRTMYATHISTCKRTLLYSGASFIRTPEIRILQLTEHILFGNIFLYFILSNISGTSCSWARRPVFTIKMV